jgi:hypothetical protein
MDSQVFDRYYYSFITFWRFKHCSKGYVDLDMVGDKDSRRSTIGYVFIVGGTIVSRISKLQKVVHFQQQNQSMLL